MSFNVAMLEAMQAEGLDLDACIRVLKAGEKRSDPTAADRMARMRARRKANDVTRNVTPEPPNDIISNPPPSAKAKGEKRAKRAPPAPIEVPDWVPAEPWAAFDGMRQSMKHKWPWTADAVKGTLDDLAAFRAAGHDIAAILMKSVKNGYRGVWAPDKPAGKTTNVTPIREPTAEDHDFMARYQAERDPRKAEHHRQEAARLRKSVSIGSVLENATQSVRMTQ